MNHPLVGIAFDKLIIYGVDPELKVQTQRMLDANRLFGYHVCDWDDSTTDLLNDRGLMGEGCIDSRGIRAMVESKGFDGMIEVEVFSNRWWARSPMNLLKQSKNPI